MGLRLFSRPESHAGNTEHAHNRNAVGGKGPFIHTGLFVKQPSVSFHRRLCHYGIRRYGPGREITVGRIHQIFIGGLIVGVHGYLGLGGFGG